MNVTKKLIVIIISLISRCAFGQISAWSVILLLLGTAYGRAGTWITLDFPGATTTTAYGVDGRNIVGGYLGTSSYHGFLYDGSSWTTLDMSNMSSFSTQAEGIQGANIVGYYSGIPGDFGFRYNGSSWTTLSYPGSVGTSAEDIDGSNIVGYYVDSSWNFHGFFYNGTTWTTCDMPGGSFTIVYGIDGNRMVGGSNEGGFLFDGLRWTILNPPWAGSFTEPHDIDGANIVGYYYHDAGASGFLYDGTTWTTLNMPGASSTYAYGIDGNNIVGSYDDAYGTHGFLYVIPEPATPLILCLGVLVLQVGRCRPRLAETTFR